jgi:hypothetical protein
LDQVPDRARGRQEKLSGSLFASFCFASWIQASISLDASTLATTHAVLSYLFTIAFWARDHDLIDAKLQTILVFHLDRANESLSFLFWSSSHENSFD